MGDACPFKTEEELYAYWLEIGGAAGWSEKISPSDLTAKLANCKIEKANPAVKQGDWIHKVIIVDESEITAYVSVVLSRLPRLRKLRIFACKTFWPFDFAAIDQVQNPFPRLEHIGLVRTKWTEDEVAELARRFPTLGKRSRLLSRGCGIGVYREHGPTQNEEGLKEILHNNKKLDLLD